ncbi:biogenesis of lysosome-related organelles complex 1 subunit 3 [Erpetoichthys calabaricus]|uniref:biogenesis of lysosome-related organelles complex 1 subunit 3 n=1 Tax=Erpetoichthys calabaricus TaxID=27687 RepID=UPI00109FC0C3|nr:biogenesis of lysosome-related organelles complex 1 subunit 3 [Erpetoichthys calabaricus]
MASLNYQTVVQGEASETDSDEELGPTAAAAAPLACGVKVPGEASETESEEEEQEEAEDQPVHGDLPPLIVIRNPADHLPSAMEEKPVFRGDPEGRCSTLLQQKLQESNGRLYCDVGGLVRQVYQNAAKDIRAATVHLNNSQNGIIGASHSIRLILEDLKSISEKMDIITSCNLLPDIRI